MEALIDRLQRKLAEAFAQGWARAEGLDALLDPDTAADPASGALSGGIAFRVTDRAGLWHVVHHARMENIADPVALDDWLAGGLSIFLMKHPTWPR